MAELIEAATLSWHSQAFGTQKLGIDSTIQELSEIKCQQPQLPKEETLCGVSGKLELGTTNFKGFTHQQSTEYQ